MDYHPWPFQNPCIPAHVEKALKGHYSQPSTQNVDNDTARILKRGGDPTTFLKENESQCTIEVGERLDPLVADAVIIDHVVADLHVPWLAQVHANQHLVVQAGETLKSIAQILSLEQMMVGLNPGAKVISVGGGSLSDAVGFLCALRGWRHGIVPTTLLAMIDASLGGKVAINLFPYGKNLVGAFYFPEEVVIDPRFLKTLDQAQIESGLCEALKHTILHQSLDLGTFRNSVVPPPDALPRCLDESMNFFEIYPNVNGLDAKILSSWIQVKNAIVEADPFEVGPRKLLNLGHTFGHAIEAHYGLSHGLAVGFGLQIEGRIVGYEVPHLSFLPYWKDYFAIHGADDLQVWIKLLWPLLLRDKKSQTTDQITLSSFGLK